MDKFVFFKVEYYAPYDENYRYWAIVSAVNRPVFWGREILGEL